MVDCPDVLHSGADLIVSLSVFLRASAFKSLDTSSANDSSNVIFNEGQETLDEQYLRERKSSLIRLFHAVGLKPHSGGRQHQVCLNEETVNTTQPPGDSLKKHRTVKTEIVGDGEEIEVEDGEDLTENELNVIYKRLRKVGFSDSVTQLYRAERRQMIRRWMKWIPQIRSR